VSCAYPARNFFGNCARIAFRTDLRPQHAPLAMPGDECHCHDDADDHDAGSSAGDDAIDHVGLGRLLQHLPEGKRLPTRATRRRRGDGAIGFCARSRAGPKSCRWFIAWTAAGACLDPSFETLIADAEVVGRHVAAAIRGTRSARAPKDGEHRERFPGARAACESPIREALRCPDCAHNGDGRRSRQ